MEKEEEPIKVSPDADIKVPETSSTETQEGAQNGVGNSEVSKNAEAIDKGPDCQPTLNNVLSDEGADDTASIAVVVLVDNVELGLGEECHFRE